MQKNQETKLIYRFQIEIDMIILIISYLNSSFILIQIVTKNN